MPIVAAVSGSAYLRRRALLRRVRCGYGRSGARRARFGAFVWISCWPTPEFSAPEHAGGPVPCQRVAGSSPALLFLNAENVTDVRQTRYDPLLLPTPGKGGRWTTDEWAPLEGRLVNLGVRIGF